MSYFLDRLMFFKYNREDFSSGHGVTSSENRRWENAYRDRWAHDKIVRSTHGVNCTGSCSWKIYVKNGLITWETQQTDYPRTRPDMPNHEPRGCARGASYSWYIYSANRLKYPMVRKRLLKFWRRPRRNIHADPVHAWASIQADEAKRREYQKVRGQGGFVRAEWDEVNELIAAANIHTIKKYGPDRIIGFSPIPAMSMVSYAAGSRYLSLLGGVCMSFYDWYCDLPPSVAADMGRADRRAGKCRLVQFRIYHHVGIQRAANAHTGCPFHDRSSLQGHAGVTITPDYSEASKFGDIWLIPNREPMLHSAWRWDMSF
jgi:nitrate reductase alpha subunit